MRPDLRFLTVGLLVAAGEAVLGVLLLGTALAAYFFGCALASAVLALAARRLLVPRRGGRGPSPGDDGGDPEPPPWWPEFESAFRRHVSDRERSAV